MHEDRKLAVLRAIVEDYVATEEPVGSKALVERHGLGVSPATVRNDMAALEEEGFITQPHTSAGRVPTDKGYRLFVDRLTTLKPMSAAEKRAIATILDGAVDLDDVVNRSVRLLAQLTRQVAVVQYPTLSRSTVRHIELVALAPSRLLVVLILSTGRVEQRLVELDAELTEDELADLRSQVNRRGRRVHHRGGGDRRCAALVPRARRPRRSRPSSTRCSTRCPTTAPTSGSRSAAPPTWPGSARASTPPCARCSRRSRSTSCCSSCSARPAPAARSRCGSATRGPTRSWPSTSVVATGYGPGDEALATLGIVGPTRMDYPGSMAAVRAVARYVSRILDEA